jgi:hypothetical protein
MKKTFYSLTIVFAFSLPFFALAVTAPNCPSGQAPQASSFDSSGNPTSYTCASTGSNNVTQGGTVYNGGGSNLPYTPLEPIPGITSGTDLTNPANFPTLVSTIFRVLITVGALLAVLMLTIGGVQYMIAESVGGKTQGIARAKAALWGIVLVAGSWLILNTINPDLLNVNLITCPTGANCTVPAAPATPVSGQPASITQLSQTQTDQAGLTGQLQNSSWLTWGAQNPPSADMINSFNTSCTQAGGQPTPNTAAGGMVCMTKTASNVGNNYNYSNGAAALP